MKTKANTVVSFVCQKFGKLSRKFHHYDSVIDIEATIDVCVRVRLHRVHLLRNNFNFIHKKNNTMPVCNTVLFQLIYVFFGKIPKTKHKNN